MMEYKNALPTWFNMPRGLLFLMKNDFVKNPFAELVLRPGDRVMDVGACVGSFAVAALESGAGHVRAYEPIEKSFGILRENLARYRKADAINAALIVGNEPTVTISKRPTGLSSTLPRPDDKTITVPALSFREELAKFKPHILKFDI